MLLRPKWSSPDQASSDDEAYDEAAAAAAAAAAAEVEEEWGTVTDDEDPEYYDHDLLEDHKDTSDRDSVTSADLIRRSWRQ